MKNKYEYNQKLIKENGLTSKDVKKLDPLYDELNEIFSEMNEYKGKELTEEKSTEFIKRIEDLEFRMQEAWKFPKSDSFHKYWRLNPLCECPQMDNDDMFGTDTRVISQECPLHGFLIKNKRDYKKELIILQELYHDNPDISFDELKIKLASILDLEPDDIDDQFLNIALNELK